MLAEMGDLFAGLVEFIYVTYGIVALGCHLVLLYLRATSDEPDKWSAVAFEFFLTPVIFIIAPFMLPSVLRARAKK